MPLTVKRAACGILDQWSVMDGHVRVAIVAESEPVPILICGELPKRVSLPDVGPLIECGFACLLAEEEMEAHGEIRQDGTVEPGHARKAEGEDA